MLNPAASLCHSHHCSPQKSRDFRASAWHINREPSAKESGRLRTKVGALKAAASSAQTKQLAGDSDVEEACLCWAEWQQPHHKLQKIRRGMVVQKGKESTPITAFDGPIHSQKHSQQDIYSFFTSCVPTNGSCIILHTEGNYLLKIFCTRGVEALIFYRCLGHIPYKCSALKWGAHSCFTGLLAN